MKRTFTLTRRNASDTYRGGLAMLIIIFTLFLSPWQNLAAQTDCCPDFVLKDAVEICPPEGACNADGAMGFPNPNGKIMAACKETALVYTVYPNEAGFTYTWTVTGGTPTSFSGNPNVIVWGTGSVGYIKVVISDGAKCKDSITAQICLIDGPEASLIADQYTVCMNTPVQFTNLSLGGSDFVWDFGDNSTTTGAGPVSHSYAASGTYKVKLTATDMGAGHWETVFVMEDTIEMLVPCGCSDTATVTVVVLPGEGPKIETDCCYGTVCPGKTSSFCSPAGCTTYNWSVAGGVITSGAGTNCIVVTWDMAYSVPTTVSLQTPGCAASQCNGITTIHVPVFYQNLPITGPTTPLCQGASGTFSLPTLPGTFYTWTVSGGGHQFNQEDRNVTSVNITFFNTGIYTVKCDYVNPLAKCGYDGSSTFTVNVLQEFSFLSGEEKVCEGSTWPYQVNGSANWSVSPSETITGQGTPTAIISWSTPGTHIITATPIPPPNYCNPNAIKVVEVIALPVLNAIVGDIMVCPNKNYTYNISSDNDEGEFTWTVGGFGNILSQMGENNDSIVVKFFGTGPWQLNVDQKIEINPGVFCTSLTKTINIVPFPLPIILGQATVCVDAIEIYTAGTSTSQEDVDWTIIPPAQGTILSGWGSNTVTIRWHGPANTATLKVTTCTGSNSKTITINGPPSAIANYNMLPIFCLGDNQTLILSTSGGTYKWYKVGTALSIGSGSALSISVASLGIGPHQYYVVVTKNGCSVKSNIIDVIIKNCTPGGLGGPPLPGSCDVVAYFWSYVTCAQVTLVDKSYVVSPSTSTITNYAWSYTGLPGATFTPGGSNPNQTFNVVSSGSYTIKLIITSSSGCTSTYSETVNILLPTANFTWTAPACVGQPISFMANPNNPAFNYAWDFGDGYTSYEAVTEHAYNLASPPNYNVSLTIKNEKGCVAFKTLPITVNPVPNCTITATNTIFCPGGSETLTACPGMSSYQWYKDGKPINLATGMTYNVKKHGEYYVEVSNQYGCSSKSNKIYMYMHPLPKAKITGEGYVCALPGSTQTIFLSTIYKGTYSYNWVSSGGATFSPPNTYYTTASITMPPVIPVPHVIEFIVVVTDNTTGCVNLDTLCVYFYETPTVSVPYLNICEGTPVTLIPTPNDPNKYFYQWSNGATTPTIVASAPGHYTLLMTNKKTGCSATADAGYIFPKPDLSLFPLGCASICPPDSLHLYIPLPLNHSNWWPNTYSDTYPNITWYDPYPNPVAYGESWSFPASGSGNHEFSVEVTNYFGCTASAGKFCLTDNLVCCEIIAAINQTDASCEQSADGSFSIFFDPTSTVAPFNVTISPQSGLPPYIVSIPAGGNHTFSGLAPGSYVVTITDASGQCQDIIEVEIGFLYDDCCFAAIDSSFIHITDPTTTYTAETVWDNKYYIGENVMVTVDGTMLDITNVDVVFDECAGIQFINGGYLRANNSVFRPCDIDKSWKGLRFDSPGKFDNIVNESTFKNAEVALYFKGGSDAVVSNGLFSNCNYGIRVDSNNVFNHPISGNRFVTEDFFPDFACRTKYKFVNNFSTYGIYSVSSRFLNQVSHNEFLNSKGTAWPRTTGVYQLYGGGAFSENTFTDMGTAGYFGYQTFYTSFENNEIEANLQTIASPPASIFVNSCKGPIIEIANNGIKNNYRQWLSTYAIYAVNSTNLSISNNEIEGFLRGITDINSINHQITKNVITNSQSVGIFVYEQPYSKGYITCNSIKMRDYNSSFGIYGQTMSPMSEVSSNCITDCRTSMNFIGARGGKLPLIRNNFLYNYSYVGINVKDHSGNIGTKTEPGLNTLWSNNNTAVDINNSPIVITVADNFGMFNISYPWVQITSNNPYHSTASCGHQIFNMPSQGNLNINYSCDNPTRKSGLLTGDGGNFYLEPGYQEALKSSSMQFEDANMIMASVENPDLVLLNEIIQTTDLTSNQEALLKYDFYYRNGDFQNARAAMEMFAPVTRDEQEYKTLSMYDLDAIANGWDEFSDGDVETMKMIEAEESVHANLAISLLNNVSGYRDHITEEVDTPDVMWTDDIKRIETGGSYLNIYPNPVTNIAYIEFIDNTGGNSKIEVFDIHGKLVREISISIVAGGIEMDVQQLQDGIYFVTITDPESGFIQKGKMVKIDNQ